MTSADRAQLHAELVACFENIDWAGFMNLVKRDPSLLVERLDGRSMRPATTIADLVAQHPITVPTTWAERLAERGVIEGVEMALATGAHPNDAAVFPRMPLLCMQAWWSQPQRVELALRYGASPDSKFPVDLVYPRWAGMTVGQRLLTEISGNSEGLGATQQELMSLAVLLRTGARVDGPGRRGVDTGDPSAAWKLARAASRYTVLQVEVQVVAAQCLSLLSQRGVDIDSRWGQRHSTPLVECIRARSRVMMDALVDAGAILDDRHHRHESKDQWANVGTLEEEAQHAWGEVGEAYVAAARMRRTIAESLLMSRERTPSLERGPAPSRRVRAL